MAYGSLFSSTSPAPQKKKNQSYVTGPESIAPPLPATPQVTPIDPIYDQMLAGHARQRDDALSQYAGQKPRVLADYGYQASGYDESGAPTGLQFDPNNPFSRQALAKRSFEQAKAGTTTSYAARGQHLSGAFNRAQRAGEFNYQQKSDALQKALTDQLIGIAGAERAARTNFDISAGQDAGDSLQRALATPPTAQPEPAGRPNAGGNPYPPGTNEWAAFAKKNNQSWKQSGGQWYRMTASGKWAPAG